MGIMKVTIKNYVLGDLHQIIEDWDFENDGRPTFQKFQRKAKCTPEVARKVRAEIKKANEKYYNYMVVKTLDAWDFKKHGKPTLGKIKTLSKTTLTAVGNYKDKVKELTSKYHEHTIKELIASIDVTKFRKYPSYEKISKMTGKSIRNLKRINLEYPFFKDILKKYFDLKVLPIIDNWNPDEEPTFTDIASKAKISSCTLAARYHDEITKLKDIYFETHGERLKLESEAKHREVQKRYQKKYQRKRQQDDVFKLRYIIAPLVTQAIKSTTHQKDTRREYLLGCTMKVFKAQIESMWEPWMNWDNYGRVKDKKTFTLKENERWEFAHAIPLSNAKTTEDIILLCRHTNIVPMCCRKNRLRGGMINSELVDSKRKPKNRIKEVMVNKELTAKLLAKQAKVNVSTLRGYLGNEAQPTNKTLNKIAKALDVTAEELLIKGSVHYGKRSRLRNL